MIFLFVSCLDRSGATRRLLVVFVSSVKQKQLISREFPSPAEHSNSFKKYYIENISAKSETFLWILPTTFSNAMLQNVHENLLTYYCLWHGALISHRRERRKKEPAQDELKMVLFCASLNLFTPLVQCQTGIHNAEQRGIFVTSKLKTVHPLKLAISSVKKTLTSSGSNALFPFVTTPPLTRTRPTSPVRTFNDGNTYNMRHSIQSKPVQLLPKTWNLLSLSSPNLGKFHVDNVRTQTETKTERKRRGGVGWRREW